MVNRPERGGAHDAEALVLDVLELCALRDPAKYARLSSAARKRGVTLKQFVADQVHQLLGTSIVVVHKTTRRGTN